MANRRDGLSNGDCPEKRCDKTVKYGIYDLFLCPACEKTRDTERLAAAEFKEISKKPSKQQAKKPSGGNTSCLSNSSAAASQVAPKTSSSDVIVTGAPADVAASLSSTAAAASSGITQSAFNSRLLC